MSIDYPSAHMAAASAYWPFLPNNQTTLDQLPILSSITENPNSDSVPMIDAPLELVGAWEGSNCGLNDPEPVPAQLQMAENGVNIWSFADAETGVLMPQTGDGYEVIVGYQCIDVGRGYWWGQVPYSDVLWCNLFQVEEEDSPDGKVVRYTNLAYGGQGVGALAQGACPTTLALPTSESASLKPLQATFVRRLAESSSLARTCNVPAGSTDRVQPSHNSQFPAGEALPNPFATTDTTTSNTSALRARYRTSGLVNPLAEAYSLPTIPTGLPVLNERTCRPVVTEEAAASESSENSAVVESSENSAGLDPFSSSAAWKPGLTLAAVAASLLSWTML